MPPYDGSTRLTQIVEGDQQSWRYGYPDIFGGRGTRPPLQGPPPPGYKPPQKPSDPKATWEYIRDYLSDLFGGKIDLSSRNEEEFQEKVKELEADQARRQSEAANTFFDYLDNLGAEIIANGALVLILLLGIYLALSPDWKITLPLGKFKVGVD